MTPPRPAYAGRLTSRFAGAAPVVALPAGVHSLGSSEGTGTLCAVPPGDPVPRPLLVFFHGAGGSAQHSLGLVGDRVAERGVLLLATSSLAPTWDLLVGDLGPDVAVLDAALAEAAGRAPISRMAVGGFSDGASYALSLGIANGDLFDAVLAFSPGFAAPPARVGSPRIWITHGTRDRVLPVDRCGRRVSAALAAAGHPVTYEEFDGEHALPADRLTAGLDWWLGPG